MKLHPEINTLLDKINELPGADRIVVFGSVARQEEEPKDLDLVLCLDDCEDFEEAQAKHLQTLTGLRELASAHYGWLDPFVRTKRQLIVRNLEATGWLPSMSKRGLLTSIKKEGVPLLEVIFRRDSQKAHNNDSMVQLVQRRGPNHGF